MKSFNYMQINELWFVLKICYLQTICLKIIYIYIYIYIYEKDLALNNPQRLMSHQTQPNQNKLNETKCVFPLSYVFLKSSGEQNVTCMNLNDSVPQRCLWNVYSGCDFSCSPWVLQCLSFYLFTWTAHSDLFPFRTPARLNIVSKKTRINWLCLATSRAAKFYLLPSVWGKKYTRIYIYISAHWPRG